VYFLEDSDRGARCQEVFTAKAALLRLRFPSLEQLRAHLHIEDNAAVVK